jgi:predicted MFS family arabinose efflux permease
MMAALFWLGLVNIFLRSSMGVMAPELAAELALSPTMLGMIASAFFLSYAVFQIPTGMLLDRFGPRIVISGLFVLTVLGTLLFASATNSTMMLLSRVLMGLGCAGIFSGAFMLIGRFYPSDKFTVIGGTLNSFAMMGTFLATIPLAYLVTTIGWRQSFYLIAIAVAVIVLLAAVSIRNWPADGASEGISGSEESLVQIFKGVGEVFRTPGVLGIATGGLSLSSGGTILGIWGGPYLNDVHGLSETGRGEVLLFLALAGVIAHYIFGRLARILDSLKKLVLGGTTAIILIMGTLALWPSPPLWAVTALFAALGLACGFPTIVLAHGRALMPAHLIGRGMTTVNTGVMVSIALMQIAVGAIIGTTSIEGEAVDDGSYRLAFGFMALMAVVTWFCYFRVKDCPPSDQ